MSSDICPSCGAKIKRGSSFCHECGHELKVSQVKQSLIEVSEQGEFTGYVQITAVIEIAIGILIAILGVLILIYSLIASQETLKSEYSKYFVDYLQIVIAFIGILMFLLGSASIYFGVKLFQIKQIGRIGSMMIGALMLIFIPFGTIFGVFALYLLIKPQIVELFRVKNIQTTSE